MHVALVANTAWLDEELTTLTHLTVGLLDEQVRVMHVVPHQLDDTETSPFCKRLSWQDSSYSLIRRYRLMQLAEPLEEMGVNVLHALDGRLWDATLRLAETLDAAVVLSAWSMLDLAVAQKLHRRLAGQRVGIAAATAPLAEALRSQLGSDVKVELVPPGVRLPDGTKRVQDVTTCIIISGTGVWDEDYEALFQALLPFVQENANTQLFVDSQLTEQHKLWTNAERFGLLSNMSLVPRRLGHREILMSADVFIQPQPLGKARSLTLQAMAHGIPVLAKQDPWLDYLIEDETAWLVGDSDPESWEKLLAGLVRDENQSIELGRSARAWVQKNRTPTMQVAPVLDLYKSLSGESIQFPQGQT